MYSPILRPVARESGFPVAEFGDDSFILRSEMIQDLRVMSYMEQWKYLYENRYFHIKMADHSLLVFSEGERPSYSYVHCPLDVVTFAEYLNLIGVADNPSNRRINQDDYLMVLSTASARSHVTPIRFDYDERGYEEGVHPVAHIHLGLMNQVRISCNRMSPLSFMLFVMRHMYPDSWRRLIGRRSVSSLTGSIRSSKSKIPVEFAKELDMIELRCI